MDTVCSVNGVPIRLTAERWLHIVEGHPELAGYYHDVLETVAWPEFLVKDNDNALVAVRTISEGKFFVVVYKEMSIDDGFIITAFFTRRIRQIERRELVWRRRM